MTLVSVIIPVYNRSAELRTAINSVLQQTLQDFEVLVVDDFSTESIGDVVSSYQDYRIKYYRLSEKGNANVARNIGIKNADSTYIAFLDSDDEFLPFHLEHRVRKIEELRCDAIYGAAYVNTSNGREVWPTRDLKPNEHPLNFLLSGGFAPTPSLFIKSAVAKKVLWNETLKRHQDYDFFARLYYQGKLIADHNPSILINWSTSRSIDYDACIFFMEKNKASIDPKIYAAYLQNMYRSAYQNKAPKSILKYYKNEALKLVKHISLLDFLSFFTGKNAIKVQLLKLYFVGLLFSNRSSLR